MAKQVFHGAANSGTDRCSARVAAIRNRLAGGAALVVGIAAVLIVGCRPDGGSATGGTDDSETAADDGGDESDDASGGGGASCPDHRFTCPPPGCTTGDCGGPLSLFDADGCPRKECTTSGICPDGRTCVRAGDFGACLPGTWGCDDQDQECACIVAGECSEDTRICIPDDLLPEANDLVPTPEEYLQICTDALETGCDQVPTYYDSENDLMMWCVERTWVPAAVGDDGSCELGDVVTACAMFSSPEAGCADTPTCEEGALPYRQGADGIEVGYGSGCTEHGIETWCIHADGELVDGPPECLCVCDEAFPG